LNELASTMLFLEHDTIIALRLGTLIPTLGFVGGCGGEPTGNIHGKVTIAGQPVALGTVAVISDRGGAVRQAAIQSGEYRLDELPLGLVRFSVHTHAPAPGMVPPGENPPSETAAARERPADFASSVPPRYGDPDKSGLTLEVQPSTQKFDLELTR